VITDYIISYTNGSGGHFLMSLLERATSKDPVYRKIKPGKYNDAHFNNLQPHNWAFQNRTVNKENDIERFKTIYKLNPEHPAFVYTHLYWPSIQLSRWPNTKLCTILHTYEDVLDISINGLYKTEMTENWHKTAYNKFSIWFSKNNAAFEEILSKPSTQWGPKELRIAVMMRKCMVIGTGFHFIEPEDNPNIFYIQYRDLVTNCDSVVDYVERATGESVSDNIVEDILGYQGRQREFMAKVKQELGL
jgi:hypothetical protein